jgi:hypothetical protein
MLSERGGSKGDIEMTKKRFTPEQIISKLREAEVALVAMFGSWVITRDPILSGLAWAFYNRTLRLQRVLLGGAGDLLSPGQPTTCRENKGSGIFLSMGGLRSLIKKLFMIINTFDKL